MFCIIARDLMGNPVWWEHCVKQHEEKKIKLVMEHSFKNCFTLFSSEYWKCICLLFSCLYLMNFYSRMIFFFFSDSETMANCLKNSSIENTTLHIKQKKVVLKNTKHVHILFIKLIFDLNWIKKSLNEKNICTTLECVFYYCNF